MSIGQEKDGVIINYNREYRLGDEYRTNLGTDEWTGGWMDGWMVT
ncbi:MAG: hypothetical protein AB2693_25610 [Candidatus Thiodiazotropha sp.]